MKRLVYALASLLLGMTLALAQVSQPPRAPEQETGPDEAVRINSKLVRTDVVVLDKKNQPINDLKLQDFELYENGKRQQLQSVDLFRAGTPLKREGPTDGGKPAPGVRVDDTNVSEAEAAAAAAPPRYIAFLVDDLTIPQEDFENVRKTLLDFVENKLSPGQSVAILRTSGSKGLFRQFTSDRQLLKRAITDLTPKLHPLNSANNPDDKVRFIATDMGVIDLDAGGMTAGRSTDEAALFTRAQMTLSVANFTIDSLRLAPGRKDLVLLSGGLPVLGYNASADKILEDATIREDLVGGGGMKVPGNFGGGAAQASTSNDLNNLIRRMTDNAARAGVVVSTLDVRGLSAVRGAASFRDTPGRSALGGDVGDSAGFGRGAADGLLAGDKPFNSMDGRLGLSSLAEATGGVAINNTNNFAVGLDRILERGQVYYVLSYVPTEKFDNTFHRLRVKVNRPDARVYARLGFYAAENEPGSKFSKEEAVLRAAASGSGARSIDLASYLQLKFLPGKKAAVEIKLGVEPSRISFKQGGDGNYTAAFDLVALVYDESGRPRGAFGSPSPLSLTPDEYRRVLASGWEVSGSTELPPGSYQLRAAVRDSATGALGILEKYFEIPNPKEGELGMSTIFLYELAPPPAKETPSPLTALRRVSSKRDLRYVALVYNPRLDKGKYRLRVKTVISREGKVLYEGQERPLEGDAAQDQSPVIAADQFNLARVPPGRYVLNLLVTDALSKKPQGVSQSIDFTVN